MGKRSEFAGTIGNTFEDSTASWAPLDRARDGSPNVVMVLLDDVGYAQFGCYGSDIATPTFDRVAGEGLRYSNFHTTALCSPTRACLLTGRNHHASGMGRIVEPHRLAASREKSSCGTATCLSAADSSLNPPVSYGVDPFSVGYQRMTPIAPDLHGAAAMPDGVITQVVIEAIGRAYRDPDGEAKAALATQ